MLIWSAHGDVKDSNVIYRKALDLTDAQKEALFPSKPVDADASDDADGSVADADADNGSAADASGNADGSNADSDADGSDANGNGSADGTDPDDGATVTDATLNWGVKESFRNYVTGPIAAGKIATSNGVTQASETGIFSFTEGSGVLKDGKGTISFKGELNFTGHSGQMDLTYSNVRVKLTSATTGVVLLDAKAPKTGMTDAFDLKNIEFAKITFPASALTIKDSVLTLKDAAVKLTTDGSKAMADFYDAGQEIDPLSINALVTVPLDPDANASADADDANASDDADDSNAAADADDANASSGADDSNGAADADGDADGSDNGSNQDLAISDATLTWGIKESFRNYVVGNIAKGEFVVSGGATQAKNNGVFSFTKGTGTLVGGKGTISFKGTVNVKGHHDEMNLTISGLRVKVTGGTTAQLIANVSAPESSMTEAIDLKDVVLADLSFDAKNFTFNNVALAGKSAVSASKLLVLKNAKATLTEAGAPALADFYEAGTVLDSVGINANATVSSGSGSDESTGNGNGTTPGAGDKTTSGAPTEGTATAQQQCRTVTVPGTTGGVSLSWGVKSSFVSYVKGGIAKGKVTTGGGAVATGSGFSWGAGSGSLSENGTGTVSFPGSVRFTGHDGLMDTTLSGLRVQVTGSGTAVLIANVKSQDMEGKDLSASNVTFANVKFSGGSASGFSGASVTLTAAGAKSFAGFYNAGQAMDSMTLSVGKASAATTKVVCGDLANTGVDNTANLVGTAGLLALLGAAAITLAARRKSLANQR
ncbi:MAG: HtaA domain-containing protein [Arthrobacter sp.]|nr:HtaA domain-containing protein [Arthrobacter sp.]